MFSSLTDLENQQFLPTLAHPSSQKLTKSSHFSTLKDKCNTAPNLKWMLIATFTLAFLYTFWHTQSPSHTYTQLSSQHAQFDEKLTEILSHISHQIHASQVSLSVAQLAARYNEGLAEGLAQQPNNTAQQVQQQPQQHYQHSANDITHPQTLRTLLDAIKTQVLQTTTQTLQTLTHALSNPHIHTTKSDKHLTAEKLVEVAVAFELSAARLISEARILTGRKDTEDLERERIVEDLGIDSQDEMTREQEGLVKEFFPVADKIAKALAT